MPVLCRLYSGRLQWYIGQHKVYTSMMQSKTTISPLTKKSRSGILSAVLCLEKSMVTNRRHDIVFYTFNTYSGQILQKA
jgi:hypothetical protein